MSGQSTSTSTVAKRGVLALVLALLVNLVLLTVILQAGVVAPFQHLDYPPVAVWTTLGTIGATVVYALLHRVSDAPDRLFVRVAVVVLVLSFVPDVALLVTDETATVGAITALAFLHVPPAVVAIGVLTGRLSRSE